MQIQLLDMSTFLFQRSVKMTRPITKIIHVNSHIIRQNKKQCKLQPPITVRKTKYAKSNKVFKEPIYDENNNVVASVVYTPKKPLPCGAMVYVECYY